MIWCLAFEKKPFQFWRKIWIQVVVILLLLYCIAWLWCTKGVFKNFCCKSLLMQTPKLSLTTKKGEKDKGFHQRGFNRSLFSHICSKENVLDIQNCFRIVLKFFLSGEIVQFFTQITWIVLSVHKLNKLDNWWI